MSSWVFEHVNFFNCTVASVQTLSSGCGLRPYTYCIAVKISSRIFKACRRRAILVCIISNGIGAQEVCRSVQILAGDLYKHHTKHLHILYVHILCMCMCYFFNLYLFLLYLLVKNRVYIIVSRCIINCNTIYKLKEQYTVRLFLFSTVINQHSFEYEKNKEKEYIGICIFNYNIYIYV